MSISAIHNDRQFETHHIIETTKLKSGGWELKLEGGFLFHCPADSPVDPKPGDIARLYGKGFGYPVRGLLINGETVFYRTPQEEEEHRLQLAKQKEEEDRQEFEKQRAELDIRYQLLSPLFRERIDGFRKRNPDFRWKFEGYEVMVCEDAARIAEILRRPERIKEFAEMSVDAQNEAVPGIHDNGHSGNSFGAACNLAFMYVTNPDLLPKQHGALCPLVGCQDYGCWAANDEAKEA